MLINKSSLDLLTTGFKAAFQESLGVAQAAATWSNIATEVQSNTAMEAYAWLGQWPQMREWVGERQIKNLMSHDYTIRNKNYEATIGVRRQDLMDDTYGVYRPIFNEMGRAAGTNDDYLVYSLLAAGTSGTCYDGHAFFSASHPVGIGTASNFSDSSGTPWYLVCTSRALKPLILQRRENYILEQMNDNSDESVFMRDEYRYGIRGRLNVGYGLWQLCYRSELTLDATNYPAARVAMLSYRSDDGRPLGITPDLLVVPPSLEASARALLEAPFNSSGATNIWYNSAKLLVTPWLS